MKRFVKFEIHEYMDEYPQENIQMWEGESVADITDKATKYANDMCANYSGGTTSFIAVLHKDAAEQWLYNKILEEIEKYHDDTSIIQIRQMCQMFEESYL